jgi:type IV secretory pathway VirB4 component
MYSLCEVCREVQRKSKEKRKDKTREYNEKYIQTPRGKKANRITNWKTKGLIHPDYDELYERYINTTNCERCNVILTEDKRPTSTTRCMDHDHNTGLFRYIVCQACNASRELRQYSPKPEDTLAV